MNYVALKWMIDSMVESHKCPSCQSEISEEDIDIIGAAGTTINIDVTCPKCGKHSMVKVEVVSMDLQKMNISNEQLREIGKKLWEMVWVKWSISKTKISKNIIKDEEIVTLSKVLKERKFKVDDLFKND